MADAFGNNDHIAGGHTDLTVRKLNIALAVENGNHQIAMGVRMGKFMAAHQNQNLLNAGLRAEYFRGELGAIGRQLTNFFPQLDCHIVQLDWLVARYGKGVSHVV